MSHLLRSMLAETTEFAGAAVHLGTVADQSAGYTATKALTCYLLRQPLDQPVGRDAPCFAVDVVTRGGSYVSSVRLHMVPVQLIHVCSASNTATFYARVDGAYGRPVRVIHSMDPERHFGCFVLDAVRLN